MTVTPDHINAFFEFLGAGLTFKSFLRVRADGGYAGIYWPAVAFFWAWGAWNLFYYPHLGQWWSAAGGVALFTANLCWLGAMWWYGPLDASR